MRAKLSFDVESKSYVWTIVHEKHPAVIEVETINGVVYIANCPSKSGLYSGIVKEFIAKKINPFAYQFTEEFMDQKTYPLGPFIFTEKTTIKTDATENYKFWNPIQREFMCCQGTDLFIPIAIAIHTDILNHVLNHPRQLDQMKAAHTHEFSLNRSIRLRQLSSPM